MEFDDWREGYVEVVRTVASRGAYSPSRGGATLEIRDMVIDIGSGSHDLPLGTGRRINTSLAAAEAIQLCAGVGMPELTEAVSSQVANFVRDADGTVHGNYGARVGGQIDDVIRKLNNDSSTRQAVIQIWDKNLDSRHRQNMPKDIPCTIAITFGVTTDGLRMSVVMRSNDVWLGLPFDVFQFRQLQRTIAHQLNIPIATYTHHVVSMHIYQHDLQKVGDLIVDQMWQPKGYMPRGLRCESNGSLARTMYETLRGEPSAIDNPSNAWYYTALGDAYATLVG